MREFKTGATRDDDSQKLDYEGFYSPIVMERFAQYMHKCRLRHVPKGDTIRASDNWQKGMDKNSYMKSGLRHVMEWWLMHDGFEAKDEQGNVLDLEEVLCAILFNVQGYLYETLREKYGAAFRVGQAGKMPGLPGCVGVNTQVETMLNVPQEVSSAAGEAVRNLPGDIESNWDGTERRGLAEGSVGPSSGNSGHFEWGSEGLGSPS